MSRQNPSDGEKRSGVHLWIAPDFRRLLEESRLGEFDAVMNSTEGRLLRRLSDRENWRLDLVNHEGRACRAYLKKHRLRNVLTWLRCLLNLGPGASAGRIEAEHIERLRQQGIPTMTLIAFGERLGNDGCLTSFLLTEDLSGYTQLDHFLDNRFSDDNRDSARDLSTLLAQVAELTRRFHGQRYNHRDLYACHFFVREITPGQFGVNLIDLQRVQIRKHFRRRWLVKDLAQLAYSAPPHCIGTRQKMAFIKRYLEVDKLRPRDKRFIRSILARANRMQRKLGPYR